MSGRAAKRNFDRPNPSCMRLHGRRAGVQEEVAPGDADVEGPPADVDRDVAGAQVEELDAVLGVGQGQLLGVGALDVSGLLEHLRGRRATAIPCSGRRLAGSRSARRGHRGSGPDPLRGGRRRRRGSMPVASISTWAWYSSWLISSAARSEPSCSAAIQASAASSTSFLPIWWTPASSSATVPEPSGRVNALSLSSRQSSSNVFIVPFSRPGRCPARCDRTPPSLRRGSRVPARGPDQVPSVRWRRILRSVSAVDSAAWVAS